ncbi:MAG TPA: ammonium transporter [Novosphingobium sp.]|nr:ammonium transporter [Novosphingobium sp.]
MRVFSAIGLLTIGLLAPAIAAAQPAAIEPDVTAGVLNSGDTAWVLVSAALVMIMAAPGLTLFYGGLLRAKNFLSVMVQTGAIVAAVSVLWIVIGYSLAFSPGTSGWIGNLDMAMLNNTVDVLHADTDISVRTNALFQMTFAAITPALMVGAWADRARFGWVVGFSALWSLLVYVPVAHWIWGDGWLAAMGTKDFAGGIVVHTTAGISALVGAALVGKRQGFPKTIMLPHSPSLTMVGAALLWAGWFGFNGGSALAASDDAVSAIINTHLGASMAALTWLLIERIKIGKPTSIGFATGAIAGLATITPAAGFVSPGAAILIGIVGALVCFPMIQLVKRKLEIDDSLDVFAVHGMGGITGSLLLAIFLNADTFGGAGYDEGASMLSQLAAQGIGVFAVVAWSALATALIAIVVGLFFPMRVGEDDEREGLDLTSHGERAWEMD